MGSVYNGIVEALLSKAIKLSDETGKLSTFVEVLVAHEIPKVNGTIKIQNPKNGLEFRPKNFCEDYWKGLDELMFRLK